AREDVVASRVDRIRDETVGERAAAVSEDGVVPVIAGGGVVDRVPVEFEGAAGEVPGAAGRGRPKDIQGNQGADNDRGGGAGGEEVAGADRGRGEGAGGDNPGEQVLLGQLVGDEDVAGRPGAGVRDGDGEGGRVAGVDHVHTAGDRLHDLEFRQQRHARRRPGGDLVGEVAEVLGQGEDHRGIVDQRVGVPGLDGPGRGEGERPAGGHAAAAGGDGGGLQVAEQGVAERVVGVTRGQDQVGAVRRA